MEDGKAPLVSEAMALPEKVGSMILWAIAISGFVGSFIASALTNSPLPVACYIAGWLGAVAIVAWWEA